MRLTRPVFALLSALAILAVGCGGSVDERVRFGIGAQFLATGAVPDPGPHLDAISAAGIDVVRHGELWNVAEPHPPREGKHSYLWGEWDRVVAAVAASDLELYALIAYGTRWANGDLVSDEAFLKPPLPGHFPDFAAYAGAVADRYGNGGSFWAEHPELAGAAPITSFEIWNEPNNAGSPSYIDPSGYARLWLLTERSIASADPGAEVVFGALVHPGAERWLREAFAAEPELADRVEVISVHLYGGSVEQNASILADYRAWVDHYADPSIRLAVTEDGLPVPPGTEEDRAALMTGMVELVRETAGITDYIPYVWLAPPGSDPEFGLANPDASLKPSGSALVEAIGAEGG